MESGPASGPQTEYGRELLSKLLIQLNLPPEQWADDVKVRLTPPRTLCHTSAAVVKNDGSGDLLAASLWLKFHRLDAD